MISSKNPVVDIAIVCSDFEESFRFYHERLGLEVARDLRIPRETAQAAGLAPRGFRQVRLRAGSTLIKLMEIQDSPPARSADFQSGVRWLTFIVDDVPATVARLKSRGVAFVSDPVPAPDAPHIVCAQAPDGLLIELVQLP